MAMLNYQRVARTRGCCLNLNGCDQTEMLVYRLLHGFDQEHEGGFTATIGYDQHIIMKRFTKHTWGD